MGEHAARRRHAVRPRRRRFRLAGVPAGVRGCGLTVRCGGAEDHAGHAEEHRVIHEGIIRGL